MKAHELAKKLLDGPDVEVCISDTDTGDYTILITGVDEERMVVGDSNRDPFSVIVATTEESDGRSRGRSGRSSIG